MIRNHKLYIKSLKRILKDAKSIKPIKRPKHVINYNLIYKAREDLFLVYKMTRKDYGWYWYLSNKGIISLEEAVAECPKLAFDLDILININEHTKELLDQGI